MSLKENLRGAWIAAAAAILDRITKILAQKASGGGIPGLFEIRPVTNTGAAFSMLGGRGLLLTVLTALIVIALSARLIIKPRADGAGVRAGLWMIVGGALGNLYDRIAFGAVLDFIDLSFVRFAVFNVADAFIVCGAVLTAAAALLAERDQRHG